MPKTVGLIPERKDMGVLAKFYGIAGNKIKDELLKIGISDFTELEADRVTRKIDAIINSMNRFVIKWSNKVVKDAYRDSMDIARTSLSILGAVKDPLFNKKTHMNAVKNGQEITAEDFIKANNSIRVNVTTYIYLSRKAFQGMVQIQAFDLRMEEVIANLLDEAIRGGASRGELDMLIRKHFKREIYEKKFININGRNYNLVSYAKMVSRTRLRQVQSEAVKNECLEYGNDLVEISDHGSETEACVPFQGNVYSIFGNTPGVEVLQEWPPFHPNCQHSASPTSEAAILWAETH